jgi:hypothetical protein
VKHYHHRPMGPRGFWEVKASRFRDIGAWKVVRLSAVRTGRLYPQEYPGTHFKGSRCKDILNRTYIECTA